MACALQVAYHQPKIRPLSNRYHVIHFVRRRHSGAMRLDLAQRVLRQLDPSQLLPRSVVSALAGAAALALPLPVVDGAAAAAFEEFAAVWRGARLSWS